ncbi:conserved hypothetical protein [Sphingomonas sp. EC-HK361]|uniref:hypothetical protein n=1 Tax=Sphingomonas sp. EC-HK361 TaxID=2038397 RepID=UPI001254BD68|nr:hypothetical protein [Sphingomonas sp. EC-HK361]VVT22805.1 conserved hypothetical protein [Sphingomonas sp. EC-HK361]
MINGETMVVLIVLIAMIGGVMKARARSGQSWRGEHAQPVESADTMRLRDEVRTLKDRVQVLERVITDNRSSLDLDQEIERLRDR